MSSLTFVGTATCLLRLGDFTLLTDPNFLHRGERAHLGRGLWGRRRTEPALGPGELPPLDAVVLSHLHGDHFDRRARAGLPRELSIVTTEHARTRLAKWGFEAATAVVHLGGTRVAGVLVTMDARQGADLVELVRPAATVPVHYDDYDVFRSPLSHFQHEMRARLDAGLRVVLRGDTVPLHPAAR